MKKSKVRILIQGNIMKGNKMKSFRKEVMCFKNVAGVTDRQLASSAETKRGVPLASAVDCSSVKRSQTFIFCSICYGYVKSFPQ